MPGPALRSDIIEVYVFRRPPGAVVEFLQLRRARTPMGGSWQPVMGHVEEGETASAAALRELAEETGYAPGRGLLHLWQLESVNTYFLAREDCVMMSPGFAAEVAAEAEPVLDAAHDATRWVRRDHADRAFLWPGQRAAVEQIVKEIIAADAPAAGHLKIL